MKAAWGVVLERIGSMGDKDGGDGFNARRGVSSRASLNSSEKVLEFSYFLCAGDLDGFGDCVGDTVPSTPNKGVVSTVMDRPASR